MKRLLFIGCDVSKGYCDFIVLNSDKSLYEPSFQLDDTQVGHEILEAKVSEYLKSGFKVVAGLENTGGYERNWVGRLRAISAKKKQLEVYKLNPKAVKHQIQSLLRRTTDDRVSAEGIAVYLINNYELFKSNWERSINQSERITEEKLLHQMIQGLIKQQTMKKNQLEKLLYQIFPELLVYIKDSIPMWVYRLLERYPDAGAVRRATLKGLRSVKGISMAKAERIKQKAKESIYSIDSSTTRLMVTRYCKDLLAMDREIKMLKEVLAEKYKDDPRMEILTSIKGVGKWTAASFLIELGEAERFEDSKQLAAFFGVHPSFRQSGDGLYKVKMSKQGSARMRAVLYLIAHNLKMHNEYFKNIYAKHRARGKKHRVVMGILMHKVLRVMWGMLKSKTFFEAGIDVENQKKSRNVDDNTQLSLKSRRLQELSLDAPISRSNSKKRKAILQPQTSVTDANTGSSV